MPREILKVSVKLGSLFVKRRTKETEMCEASRVPLHLENPVGHVIVHFEARKDCTLPCDVHDIQYERIEGPEGSAAQPFPFVALNFRVLHRRLLRFSDSSMQSSCHCWWVLLKTHGRWMSMPIFVQKRSVKFRHSFSVSISR